MTPDLGVLVGDRVTYKRRHAFHFEAVHVSAEVQRTTHALIMRLRRAILHRSKRMMISEHET